MAARLVRILPIRAHGYLVCMRAEIIGCSFAQGKRNKEREITVIRLFFCRGDRSLKVEICLPTVDRALSRLVSVKWKRPTDEDI